FEPQERPAIILFQRLRYLAKGVVNLKESWRTRISQRPDFQGINFSESQACGNQTAFTIFRVDIGVVRKNQVPIFTVGTFAQLIQVVEQRFALSGVLRMI